ncbi:MAG: sialidase family protein, partial [Bacteroidota bacterium]
MKLRFLLLFSPFLFLFACSNSSSHQEYHPLAESPGPSDEDDPLRDSLKQVFLDQLYFAEEGLNVDSIRHANRLLHRAIKQEQRQKANPRSASEFFANDNIEAIWHERGPDNEAGDIKIVDYVPSLDRLYAISSVGHLWRGSTAGDDWELLNDDIQLETNIIRVLPHNGGTRIFACYGAGTEDKEVRYSDDEGVTWTKGTGFDFYDHWGAARRLYALSDGQTLYYLVHTWSASPWGQLMQIYKSTDKGQTYSQIVETPVGYETDEMDMWKPYDSDLLYVIDNEAKEYFRINHNFATGSSSISTPVSYSNQGIANGRIHVSGRQGSSATRYDLYIYHSSNDNVYKTTNGSNWTFLSQASDNVWRRGWLADPHNDNLYVGSFQLNKTTDLINWEEQYDRWWEYYSVSKDSMHVDIMSLDYFEKSDGTPFITICNHAGIHITYDHFKTTENLAWTSLQVTTLYDQTTASDGFLYCGAQDKGTFVYRGNSQADYSILSTQNTTTGDGMIGSFFNSDQSYYSMIQ